MNAGRIGAGALALLMLTFGCRKRETATGGEHSAGHEHAPEAKAGPEIPTHSVTLYQNGLELFMEYPAFIVGRGSPLVAHVTDVRDARAFKPVTRGHVTALLVQADGSTLQFVADKPLRDGIFKPTVTPSKPGEASLRLVLEGEQASGSLEVGKVVVHARVEAAGAATVEEQKGEPKVAFLKEQQWKTRYATALVGLRNMSASVRANGEVRTVAGKTAELSTPVPGRIPVEGRVPFLGQPVRRGELLASVTPTSTVSGISQAEVELELTRAQAELGLADRELKRNEELLAAQAIPEKQLDAARTARQVAAARLAAAERQRALYRGAQVGSTGRGRGAFELRAPFDGVVAFADVTPGAVVEAGTRLVTVVNTDRVWLEAKVYENDAAKLQQATAANAGATFTVAGIDQEFVVDARAGKRVAIGAVVDRATRTVPVIFELPNPDGLLKPGMFAKVNVLTGDSVRAVAVPESAVVDDNGRPVIFVMEGGESFFKRAIRPGVRSGGFVQVEDGVKEGERVVVEGAYEIKLSTASGAIPAHGHEH